MAGTTAPPQLVAYRCPSCGRTEVRVTERSDVACPRCGVEQSVRISVVGQAVGYSVADRTRGPSIEDGRLGSMAYFFGWMTLEQVAACLQLQRQALADKRRVPHFGEAAVSAGILSEEQVEALLHAQAIHRPTDYDRSFGTIAVRRGFVSQRDLDACLEVQEAALSKRREAPCLGLLMVEKKLLSGEQVKRILKLQVEMGTSPIPAAPNVPLPEAAADAAGEAPGPAAGDRFEDLPGDVIDEAEGPEEPEGAEERGAAIPPPPKIGEKRIVCRCNACGHAQIHDTWHEGDPCPACGARPYVPVPITEGAYDYTVADRSHGPAVEDGRLGRLAFYAGWATDEEIKRCLRIQQNAVAQGKPAPKFGEVAAREGVLSNDQVAALLRIQGVHRPRDVDTSFGAVAVKAGFITQGQLDETLDEQTRLLAEREEAPLVGMMLEEKGFLTPAQVKAILDLQAKYNRGALSAIYMEEGKPSVAVEEFKEVVTSRRNWGGAALVTVVALAIAALATGWFGYLRHDVPDVVVGCSKCGVVLELSAEKALLCPKCGGQYTLSPVAECQKCKTIYLYGVRGSGSRCPKCGSGAAVRVEDVKSARNGWKFQETPADIPGNPPGE